MSHMLPEATIELERVAYEQLESCVASFASLEDGMRFYDIFHETVQATHLVAMAEAIERIVTIEEIADELGIHHRTVRARLRNADPPILPIRVIHSANIYTVEDIPRIAVAHASEVTASGKTVLYLKKSIRDAIEEASRMSTQRRLAKNPEVKYADWGVKRRNRTPEKVTIELNQHQAAALRQMVAEDGVFVDLSHLVRTVCELLLENREGTQA